MLERRREEMTDQDAGDLPTPIPSPPSAAAALLSSVSTTASLSVPGTPGPGSPPLRAVSPSHFPLTPPRAVSGSTTVNVSTRLDAPRSRKKRGKRDKLGESSTGDVDAHDTQDPSDRRSTFSPPLLSPASLPAASLSASTSASSSARASPSPHPSPRPRSRKGKNREHAHSHSVDTSASGVPEAEVEDVEAVGQVSAGGDVRRELRELVGNHKVAGKLSRSASSRGALQPAFTTRRYYVLTNAGKPVFSIGHTDEDSLTNMMGVTQALISIFAMDDDKPRCIMRGRTRISFLVKQPLYLFAVSDWGEPDYVLRMHLEYINLQILSVVSASQLSRAFQRRSNFDLSRLLEGSEPFLNKLVAQCQDDLSFVTTTLQPLRMAPALRDTAAAALTTHAKQKDLLYVLLIAGGHIVTLLRPRRHTVHPADMHLLLNTLKSSATLRTVETWLPICLPKFNPAGFVHAYISFVREDVGLVFISADRDAFESLCAWRAAVVDTLNKDGALDRIEASIKSHAYSVAAVGSPGLRHFVYKSRGLIQLTAPEWEDPYSADSDDRRRLVTLYEKAQDALFARSGQPAAFKLVYMANEHEAVLGWLTKPFELYIAVSPHLPMSAVVSTANKVAKWVNAGESRLFLKDAPVF